MLDEDKYSHDVNHMMAQEATQAAIETEIEQSITNTMQFEELLEWIYAEGRYNRHNMELHIDENEAMKMIATSIEQDIKRRAEVAVKGSH